MELSQSSSASQSLVMFLLLLISTSSSALLNPEGVNLEVQALISVKNDFKDPNGVLKDWDISSVDPCSWPSITCSDEGLVTTLKAPRSNLSGRLSPTIGNLTRLETLQLQNNNITGPIPATIGKLVMLRYIDLSYNNLRGPVPRSSAKTDSGESYDMRYKCGAILLWDCTDGVLQLSELKGNYTTCQK